MLESPTRLQLPLLHLDSNDMLVAQPVGLNQVSLSYMIDKYNFYEILGFLYLGKKKKKKVIKRFSTLGRNVGWLA